jgi:putative hydrolase of the HAD superfamily
MTRFGAIIFDLGGVVLDSPLEAIARFEAETGLPDGFINRTVVDAGANGAWAGHERGELTGDEFLEAFAAEFAARGHRVDTPALMERIDGSIHPRPSMLRALRTLSCAGYTLGAITNNWHPFGSDPIVGYFDVFVESVVEGVRKPEPEIYRRCLERLGTRPEACVMLDDIGPNLKPARQMGMTTIKVTSIEQALGELSGLLGMDLPS